MSDQPGSPSDTVSAMVTRGSYLTLHYRITLASGPGMGQVFIDTFEGRPATLQLGSDQWAPGLEEALIGHSEGEQFKVRVAAAQAYGERNPELIQRITRKMLAEHAGEESFEPGDLVEFAAPQGGRYSGVLKQIDDTHAVFDFNHPLAGVDVDLEVQILGVM